MKTFKNTLLALALSFGAAACDGTEPDPTAGHISIQTDPTSSTPGANAAVDVTPFLGAWTYASGSDTTTCGPNSGTTEISAAKGTLQITAGTEPNKIVVSDASCVVSATVSGDRAVAEPGTACAGGIGTTSIVYTVSGRTLHKQASAIVAVAKLGESCGKTEDATLVHE